MRWRGWSARGLALLGWAAVLLWAAAAERTAYTGADVRHWLPDLLTGLVLVGAGSYAVLRRDTPLGLLIGATGVLWFLPNFAGAAGALGALATDGLFLYRGPLVHALLAFPTGRVATSRGRAAVLAGYLLALVPEVWGTLSGTAAAAAALALAFADSVRRAPGRLRRARVLAGQVAAALAVVLVGSGFARQGASSDEVVYPTLIAFELVLAAVVVVLVAGLRQRTWERGAVIDLVLDLDDRSGGTLRDRLAWTLGDPGLQLTFDPADPIEAPEGSERTVVREGGKPVAALTHRPGLLADPDLRAAIVAAVRLGAENALLQHALEDQVDDVAASRRRLVTVADEETERLERRLSTGPVRTLAELDGRLDDPELAEAFEAAVAGLRDLAHGLHPRPLAEKGLVPALEDLAAQCPVPVIVEAAVARLPEVVELTAYFVCSEALANVVKHAQATSVRVRLADTESALGVEVTDDGLGGADLASGSGLRGLADRLAALGGAFSVSSAAGSGCRVRATIPLDGAAREAAVSRSP